MTSVCGSEQTGGKLSQDDVFGRLFAPSSHLPEPRVDNAIVTVTAGGVERSVTHRQLENLLGFAVKKLKEHGVKEGDKVAFYCENSPELVATILACWTLNAMATLIDYRAERSDVLAMSKKLEAKILVTSNKLYKDYKYESKLFSESGLAVLDACTFAEHENTEPETQIDLNSIDVDRPAFTILTSGTTGAPKAAVHSLRSLAQNMIDLLYVANLPCNLTALTPLPLSHIFGLTVFLITQVIGAKTVLTELEPVGFVKAVHRHKPELIAALPQFYGAFLSAPKGFINLSNSRLLLCGGAPLTVSLAEKFEETFGKRLNNGYGSTESKLLSFNTDGPVLSVGKPIVKTDIVSEQDEVLPPGKLGEVRITGTMLMSGYLDNEEETKKVLRNGRYYTGDIGRFEGESLFVVGRKTDVVLVDGVVVYSGEVEEVLRNNVDVKDVAITAAPSKETGQAVRASIVLVKDDIAGNLKSTNPTEVQDAQHKLEDQFKAYCEHRLSRYQRPTEWHFLGPHDDLPKTLAGKIDKKKIAANQR